MVRRRPRSALLLAALALLGAACGQAGTPAGGDAPADPSRTAAPVGTGTAVSGTVTVSAAASLTDAFTRIAGDFERRHPAVTVSLNLAGSQQLATQIVEGAPVDVFASADSAQMDAVVDGGRVAGTPQTFTGNQLAIAVEPGNPEKVHGLDDLAREGLTVVLAAEEVPAGRYARQALDAAGVDVTPDSLETDVRAALTKVVLGEADAAVVYASDIVAAGDAVKAVTVPGEVNVAIGYPIAAVADGPNPRAADAFIDYVRSHKGQTTLAELGFSPP